MQNVRSVQQHYWYSAALPQLEVRSTYGSTLSYRKHQHRQFSLGAVVTGTTCSHYLAQEHLIHAGQLILIEPERPHSCNPLAGQARSYHMLYLDSHWCLQQLSALYGQPVAAIRCSHTVVDDPPLFRRYQQLIAALPQGSPTQIGQLLDTLLLPIFSRYCSPQPRRQPHPVTQHVRQRLLNNLLHPPSLETLAGELQLRKETLVRIFNRELGITPMALLNNVRIEYAKSLLRRGDSLADVSYHSGFSDQSHFHKTFVQLAAATPGQYRQGRSIFDNN